MTYRAIELRGNGGLDQLHEVVVPSIIERILEVRQGAAHPHINYPSPSAAVQDCLLRVGTGIIAGVMRKSVRRALNDAKALCRTTRHDGAGGQSESPAHRDSRDQRCLLDRILDTPHLAHVVPRLQPEVLHRIIQSCGLEDCGELLALATPDQLMRVFDLDLWRSDRPGLDEELDAHRFGVWFAVLMESGATVAAQKLVGVDIDLVIGALAQHV